jgi:hypothetical protein
VNVVSSWSFVWLKSRLKNRTRFELFFLGLRQFDRSVEDGLDGRLLGWGPDRPGDGDAREGLGNEEAIPGAKLPGAVGMEIEGADGGAGEFCELRDAWLGDHRGAAGAVGGDGAVVAGEVGPMQIPQAGGAVAGTRASNGNETETFDGAGDEFSIKTAADEDADAAVAEAPGADEQTPMPEGVDGGRRDVVTGSRTEVADIPVAEGHAETADRHAREARDDGEGDALLEGVGVGHG